MLLAFFLSLLVVRIGSYNYTLDYRDDTLGKTTFPIDDALGGRYIDLPNDANQFPISWEHEKLHACMHDHTHHYKSIQDFEMHMHKQTYTEEEVVTILAPCLLALNNVDLRHNVQRKTK